MSNLKIKHINTLKYFESEIQTLHSRHLEELKEIKEENEGKFYELNKIIQILEGDKMELEINIKKYIQRIEFLENEFKDQVCLLKNFYL